MNKNVIVNVRSDAPVRILESRVEGSDLYLVGEFTTFDVMNRNKRMYRKDNYKMVLEQIADKCAAGALLGELGHPSGRNTTELPSVSHVVTKLEIDEEKNCVIGEIKLLDTPNGRIARTLVESNVPLYVSSRASGYIGKGGVVTLTNLITYDLVDEPGFANARLTVRDITEGLCGEGCDECENAAIYVVDDEAPAIDPQAVSAQTVSDSNIAAMMDSISKLSSDVASLANSVAALSKRVDAIPTNVPVSGEGDVSAINIETIIDSKISEAVDEMRKTMFALDERRIRSEKFAELRESTARGSNSDLETKVNSIIQYMDYVVNECNERNKYMDYVVNECNARNQYMDYVVNECNTRNQYMDYVVNECNNGGVGSADGCSDRISIIESYLENIGREINKSEKAMNEKFESFVNYVDYFAKTINENNAEVDLLQTYIDEHLQPAVGQVINEARDNDVNVETAIKNINAVNERLDRLTNSLNERLEAVTSLQSLNADDTMSDVKALLENINSREAAARQDNANAAKAQQANASFINEERRLLSFMHASVKHIWESFDQETKMKIASDMSVAKSLAVPTQTLMLTRMINNFNIRRN